MTRLFLLTPFLLLVACEDEVLETPKSATAPRDLDDLGDDRVTVELTRYGLIRSGGKVVNLDQFAEALHEAAIAYDVKMKAKGKSGWESIPGAGGFRASRMNLVIRADKEAPWQHIQWLLTAAARQRYYKIYYGATRDDGKPGRVKAFLPTDKALGGQQPIVVSVHLIVRKEEPRVWAGQQINAPTEFRFRHGKRESKDIKAVTRWVDEAKKTIAPNGNFRGEIKAGHKVPFRLIVGALERIHAAGMQRVDFFGTQIAHEKLRKKMRLPYPNSNYGRTK